MTIKIDEHFSNGSLGVFTATTAGSNTVAHATDIDHTQNPSGSSFGAAKFSWAGTSGTAYIENTTVFGLGFGETHIFVRFYVYFDTMVPNTAKINTAGGGTDWKFFDIRDNPDVIFSIYASPNGDNLSIPHNHFGFYGRWEQATAFVFGEAGNISLETGMWHRFWAHYVKSATAGIMEWGINDNIVGQTQSTMNTNSYSPDYIRIGGITSSLGRPDSTSVMYVDDVKLTTSNGSTYVVDSEGEFSQQNPYWQRVGAR